MKVLVIRFSSFGDVLQTLSVAGRIHRDWPQAEIHWVTRDDFVDLVQTHPAVHRVWSVPRKASIKDVLAVGRALKSQQFTHVYDAHNNLRSRILGWQLKGLLSWHVWSGELKFLRRSIYRWKRWLLFNLRINKFPKPFSGQFALLEPLLVWGLSTEAPSVPLMKINADTVERVRGLLPPDFAQFVALAPSAAFELKRWPLEHWQELIRLLPSEKFVVLGGSEDKFLFALEQAHPGQVLCLAGRLNLIESAAVVGLAKSLVANDTGLMHVAEQLGRPCVALMGPAPFGFPSRALTQIMQLDLSCRPCSKHGQGPCVNAQYQWCLRGIPAEQVAREVGRANGLHI
jgi:ADP-heptose:LPS heptosyltransferase